MVVWAGHTLSFAALTPESPPRRATRATETLVAAPPPPPPLASPLLEQAAGMLVRPVMTVAAGAVCPSSADPGRCVHRGRLKMPAGGCAGPRR
jgi:hypothetical protein